MTENKIARTVFECALEIHKELGPGLLESSYEECLYYELKQKGLKVNRQKPLPLVYKEVKMECGYRVDLMVEDKFIVEIKSIETLLNIHTAQLITYLKLSKCRLGFLINFNVKLLKEGVKRIIV